MFERAVEDAALSIGMRPEEVRGLNLYQADVIFADMLNHAKLPEGIFHGSPETMDALTDKIRAFQGH